MRHRFEAYLDKVFDFPRCRAALPEGRQYPRIPWSTIFDAVFLGAACQFPSLHQLEAECAQGVLRTRIGRLSEDAIAYALQYQPSLPLLDHLPPLFLYQLGRSRWTIDAEVFQTLTTDSHLKKPSVHQNRPQALVVLTMIRLLAYTLALVFYHRQVLSHDRGRSCGFRQFAHTLAYWFLCPNLNSS